MPCATFARCVAADCQRSFARKCDLMSHTRCAHGGLHCEACGLRFRKKAKLQRHWQLVHPFVASGQKVPPKVCPHCGKSYGNLVDLERHILSRHEKGEKKYKCKSCEESFEQFLDMLRHRKLKHPKSYSCSECDFVSKRSDQLKHHVDTVHRELLVHCKQAGCEHSFTSKKAMRLHVRVAHLKMKDFKCLHCQKVFAYKGVLRRHIEKVHKMSPTAQELERRLESGC